MGRAGSGEWSMAASARLSAERKYEICGVLILGATFLLFLALATDGYQGENRRPITALGDIPNALGEPGAAVAGFLYILLGHGAHVLYVLTFVWGAMLLRHLPLDRLPTRLVGTLLLASAVAGLLHINYASPDIGHYPGGALGAFVSHALEGPFGPVGANIISATLGVIGLLLATEFLFVRATHTIVLAVMLAIRSLGDLRHRVSLTVTGYRARRQAWQERRSEREKTATKIRATERKSILKAPFAKKEVKIKEAPEAVEEITFEEADLSRIRVTAASPPEVQELPFDAAPGVDEEVEAVHDGSYENGTAAQGAEEEEANLNADVGEINSYLTEYGPKIRTSGSIAALEILRRKTAFDEELPPDYEYPKKFTKPDIEMLERARLTRHEDHTAALRQMGLLLEERLRTFGIEARVTDVTRGPTITRFELEPAPGIKVSRFMSLADDLALALKAHRVRVEAPIPGKGRVGIEVPNDEREAVVIRELLESRTFNRSGGALTLALGKDITGDVIVADLATMPHLLVAGATGAGKTVCVKTVLASLLFSKTPEEMQLMLIDPKMVELSIFNDIPHLITPVVIDPKKAAASLNWLINEMEERYRLFAHLRVRNIEIYNQSVENGEIEMAGAEQGDDTETMSIVRKLPYIVCIIDELADLMMLARAEVEDAIARLAQLARAVGIHLIIATQRPSVDVLTGVIKANFPARVSFQVSSRVDSRCILDEIGAERLIGQGDMLYLPPGRSKPLRVQGAFVSDAEMNSLIAYLKTQAPPQYRDEIENWGKQQSAFDDFSDEEDDLLNDAIRVVVETGQASISMVQRRLRVGYTRAARLIDMMEQRGIVGPHVGSKAREILVPTAAGSEGDA